MSDTKAARDYAPLTGPTALGPTELDAAVGRGIITAEQRDRLLAMAAGVPAASRAEEASRTGMNLVTIGYWTGSIAVVFALAWFLADRWKALHPAGVLAVALLYALCLGISSMFVSRLGYRFAGSLLALLTVMMAPIVMWALESLLGLWPSPSFQRDMFSADVIESVRWIPVQLGTALAGLIALRKVRFGLLTLTVTVPMGMALVQLTPWLLDPELNFRLGAWMTLFAATLMFLAAYVIDRRDAANPEDYAGWVYLAAVGFLIVGLLGIMDQSRVVRHSLPALIAALVATGFALRRRFFLLPATLVFIMYLVFLAHEVFPTATGFMLVMLAVGVVVILGTVVAQRRFPHLIRRFTGEGGPRPATHALGAAFGACAMLTLVLLFASVPVARRDLAKMQQRRNAAFRGSVERQRSEASARRRGAARVSETPGTRAP